jgi:hypothetical protein
LNVKGFDCHTFIILTSVHLAKMIDQDGGYLRGNNI